MNPPAHMYCIDEETGELPYELTRRQQHITVFFPFASASFSPFAYADPAGPPPMCKNASGLEPRGQTVSFLDLHGNEYLGAPQQRAVSLPLKEEVGRTGWMSEQDWFEGGDESDGQCADNFFLRCPASLDLTPGLPTEAKAGVSVAEAEEEKPASQHKELVDMVDDFVVVEAPVRPILKMISNGSVRPTNAKRVRLSIGKPTLDQGARAHKNVNDSRKEQQRVAPGIVKFKSMVADLRTKRSKIPRRAPASEKVNAAPTDKTMPSKIPRWKWT
ncbi:hypothetical protein C8Q80DRAFT_1266225 [Daedaleopsis nitida]|nr:hypothetical protein C8Q80DRAFT_1266225 [Daedaleopsis nitida]